MMKNVALAPCAASTSRIESVVTAGPSSMVRAISFSEVSRYQSTRSSARVYQRAMAGTRPQATIRAARPSGTRRSVFIASQSACEIPPGILFQDPEIEQSAEEPVIEPERPHVPVPQID